MVRRTHNRRTREKRDKGQAGVSLPSRNQRQHEWKKKEIESLRKIHELRTSIAQATDEALTAPLAPSPEAWIQHPGDYDVHGVDYPEHRTPKAKRDLEPHQQMEQEPDKQPTVPEKPSLTRLRELHREAIPDKPRTDPRTGKQPDRDWLPEDLEKELVAEWNRPEEMKTGVALVKYFTPDGAATWYFSEYYPTDDVFYGWCDVGLGFPELGYVSRQELRELRGKMGLPVERDYYYEPTHLNTLEGKPVMPEGYESLAEKKQSKAVNHKLSRGKGAKWEPHQREAQPIVTALLHPEAARIEAQGDKVTYVGMDQSHITMMKLTVPNTLDIPEGRYQAEEYSLDNRVTVYNYPEKLTWDPEETSLSVENKNQHSSIQYQRVDFYDDELPEPRINYSAKATLDLTRLYKETKDIIKSLSGDGGEVIVKLCVEDGELTYRGENTSTDSTVTGNIGELKLNTDNPTATYNADILVGNLERLVQSGFTEATLDWTQDMPLKLTAHRGDGSYTAEYWQAPMIGA